MLTSVIALATSVRASSRDPAAEVRLLARESRSFVFTETAPPATTTAAPPPQMVQVWPVSSGAGPAYGAGGVLGFGGDDLEAGDSVAWGSCFQAGYGPLESSMATGLMTDSFQPESYVTR